MSNYKPFSGFKIKPSSDSTSKLQSQFPLPSTVRSIVNVDPHKVANQPKKHRTEEDYFDTGEDENKQASVNKYVDAYQPAPGSPGDDNKSDDDEEDDLDAYMANIEVKPQHTKTQIIC